MSLFKSGSEKLSSLLADREAEAVALAKRAEEARAAEAEAQARLVEDLAEGLDVDKWRKAREAAEKKAADAERDLKAARDAAEIVRGKLAEARHEEALSGRKARHAAAEAALPAAVADVKAALLPLAVALSRLEAIRSEEHRTVADARALGDRELRTFGVPAVEDLVREAIPGDSGPSRWVRVDVPIGEALP